MVFSYVYFYWRDDNDDNDIDDIFLTMCMFIILKQFLSDTRLYRVIKSSKNKLIGGI